MQKTLSLLLAIALLFAFCASASASELALSPQGALSSGSFVPMSKDEYNRYVNILTNGSELEKSSIVNEIFRLGNDISTHSWSSSYTQDMGDGTYLIQGFVKCSHTKNKMTVNTVVPASMRGTNYSGYTWVGFNNGYSSAATGYYTYSGSVSASLLDATRLYVSVIGTFEITENDAHTIGVNLELMNLSYTSSSTKYYRTDFQGSHVEYPTIKG